MKARHWFVWVAVWICLTALWAASPPLAGPLVVTSPSGLIRLHFRLNDRGEPEYSAEYRGTAIVAPSKMGLLLAGRQLVEGFRVAEAATATRDEAWKPVWGEVAEIRDRHNELSVQLENAAGRLGIIFRVSDDGIGFRYGLPAAQPGETELIVKAERTDFAMTGDHTAWWIPGDWDSNEHRYATTPISGIDALGHVRDEEKITTQFIPDHAACQTPVALRTAGGIHLAIHEAALVNFPAMQLKVDRAGRSFRSFLVPGRNQWRTAAVPPGFRTPWRVILIAPDAARLLESKLILNLNEPCRIGDTSWIRPMKYVGIWWEMHIGKSRWDRIETAGPRAGQPHGRHGATTENTRRYIDFAARHGFGGVLVEGWNTGWEEWYDLWKEDVFDFQTPYPDYDLAGLARYSIEKGAPLIVHHETSSAVTSYERHLDAAFGLIRSLGLHAIKTGYVGRIIPRGEWHDGQWMVNHYNRVLEKAAASRIMVDAHEPVRPTGLHRTWPNFMACEATRGNEFNAWSRGNPPEHETILPFTRGLGGPIDYTPGIFDIRFEQYQTDKQAYQVHTTLAKQLALYVTLYSPLQMAADLPENYERRPDAFQFIRDVAVDWDDTRVLAAEIGDFLTVARKGKGSPRWFLGAITDENARKQSVRLDFLPAGLAYEATLYEDGPGADWRTNPTAVSIRKMRVTRSSVLALSLAPGGGCAVSLVPVPEAGPR